jgi:hypothetical protein
MLYIQWPVGQFGFMESENKYQISNNNHPQLQCEVLHCHVGASSFMKQDLTQEIR